MKNRIIAVLAVLMLVLPFSGIMAQDQSIVEIAAGNEDFSTLVSLVQAAELVDALSAEGPLTVFAPTNAAFEALPAAVIDYLANTPEALVSVLTHHVVEGAVLSTDLAEGDVPSLQGSPITVSFIGGGVQVDGANVVTADLVASNGVIHVIDSVILPDFELPAVDPLAISDNVIAAGSSTVFPVTERMADLFNQEGFAGTITVDSIGSGAGYERFCVNAETDIANASRPIRQAEIDSCVANGREPIELLVGIDALSVVVSTNNTFVQDLSTEQLAAIFSGEAATWADVDASYPAEPIRLFSPGTDSGTFDYFVEVIFDENEEPILNAPGIQFSEDDNVLVQGVEGSEFAIGYFGYAYYLPNADRLRAVNVNGIEPNAITAETGEYPLSRPLFIYTTASIMQEKPQVAAFVNYYLTNVNSQLGTNPDQIGYFPASSAVGNFNRLMWLIANQDMGM